MTKRSLKTCAQGDRTTERKSIAPLPAQQSSKVIWQPRRLEKCPLAHVVPLLHLLSCPRGSAFTSKAWPWPSLETSSCWAVLLPSCLWTEVCLLSRHACAIAMHFWQWNLDDRFCSYSTVYSDVVAADGHEPELWLALWVSNVAVVTLKPCKSQTACTLWAGVPGLVRWHYGPYMGLAQSS